MKVPRRSKQSEIVPYLFHITVDKYSSLFISVISFHFHPDCLPVSTDASKVPSFVWFLFSKTYYSDHVIFCTEQLIKVSLNFAYYISNVHSLTTSSQNIQSCNISSLRIESQSKKLRVNPCKNVSFRIMNFNYALHV